MTKQISMETNVYIPDRIMQALRNLRGLDDNDTSQDQEILSMSKREFLDAWLAWEGIYGYTTQIMDMIYYAFGVDLESDEVWEEKLERRTGDENI